MNEGLRSFVYGTVLALAVGYVLWIGASIFLPIVFSVLIVYVILGTTRLLARLPWLGGWMPGSVNLALSIALIALAVWATFWLVLVNLGKAVELAPRYQESFLATVQGIANRLGIESQPTWATLRKDILAQVGPQRLIGLALGFVSSVASTLVICALYVAFMLIERESMPRKIANLSDDPAKVARLQKMITHVNDRIGRYLALKTLVCLITGFVSWMVMAGVGLDLAAFWGVLIALMNYVPYIGSFLSVVIPVSVGLLQFGPSYPLLILLLLMLVLQFFLGNVLDPYLMANSLNLSLLAILVSLAVWSTIWGISGAFLAVPLTACLAMLFAEFKGTRPIAVLLSKTGEVGEA